MYYIRLVFPTFDSLLATWIFSNESEKDLSLLSGEYTVLYIFLLIKGFSGRGVQYAKSSSLTKSVFCCICVLLTGDWKHCCQLSCVVIVLIQVKFYTELREIVRTSNKANLLQK